MIIITMCIVYVQQYSVKKGALQFQYSFYKNDRFTNTIAVVIAARYGKCNFVNTSLAMCPANHGRLNLKNKKIRRRSTIVRVCITLPFDILFTHYLDYG